MLPLLILLASARADRLVVDPGGAGDHLDLQDAVDAALPGDHIVARAGTYGPVDLSAWSGPIVGLDGADLTVIEAQAGVAVAVVGQSPTLVDLTLVSADGGATVEGGRLTLRRVRVHPGGAGVTLGAGASLDARALVVAEVDTCGVCDSAGAEDVFIDGATLVGAGTHLLLDHADFQVRHLITWGGTPVDGCAQGPSGDLAYALLAEVQGAPYPACVAATAVTRGLDPRFVAFTDDGDPEDDDLALGPGSPALDAGDPACFEPDGTVCDLGGLAGPVANAVDDDADGMPESWELAFGLDPSLDDGEDDPDGDGLDNLGEHLFGCDPLAADSDGDGVDDLDELRGGADPADPADQAPRARVVASDTAFVGEALLLDGSASSDPGGDPLTWAWAVRAAPEGSARQGALLSAGPRAELVPDVPGDYVVQLSVSDGFSTGATVVTVTALAGRTLRIPEDAPDWGSLVGLLRPGMSVRFGEGWHAVSGEVPAGVTVIGQGPGRTTLEGDGRGPALRVSAPGVRLRGFTLVGGASYGLYVAEGGRVEARDLAVVQPGGVGVTVNDGAALVAVDLLVQANLPLFNDGGVVALGRSLLRSEGGDALSDSQGRSMRMEGVWLDGGGATLSGSRRARLGFVTARGAGTAFTLVDVGPTRVADALLWGGARAVSCTRSADLTLDRVMGVGVAVEARGCGALLLALHDTLEPAADGRLREGAAAIDAGDPWRQDADGSPADLGATGGPWGLYSQGGPADPDVDADGDGLTALSEALLGADDGAADSDGDGVSDLDELMLGDDPGDPFDHMPEVARGVWRVLPGAPATLTLPPYGADPDGDPCTLTWADGGVEPRTLARPTAGVTRLPWVLRCGAGRLAGEALLIAEQRVEIATNPALAAARDAAEDHHVLVLAEGDYIEALDLRGLATRVEGAGEGTRLYNGLWLDHPAAGARDLALHDRAGVVAGGELRRIDTVNTDLWLRDVNARSVLTRGGDLHLRGEATRAVHLTTQGDLSADGGRVGCAVVVGEASTPGGIDFNLRSLGARTLSTADLILVHADPEASILAPFPTSPLTDACRSAGGDHDGSPADFGHTGGREAAPVDRDGDGLNDAWEAWRGVDEPGLDPDGDGLDNLAELAINTDPLNPDTDGDLIPDGEDPDPLQPGGAGLVPVLDVDRFPAEGQEVNARAHRSTHPAGLPLTASWSLEAPMGSAAALVVEGDRARFTPDLRGPYDLTLTVSAPDGASAEAVARVWRGELIPVPAGADVQAAVDAADPGDRLVLEGAVVQTALLVEKDLVISHAGGAGGGRLEGEPGLPAITVREGARLRLERITVAPDPGDPGVAVRGSTLELRQAWIPGGSYAIEADTSHLDLAACALTGSSRTLRLSQSTATITSCTLGYTTGGSAPILALDSRVELRGVAAAVGRWGLHEGWGARVEVFDSVLEVDPPLPTGGAGGAHRVYDLGLLLPPELAPSPYEVDLRLALESPARDAGPAAWTDVDGSRADAGALGGPLGDWPDVDNDRDGYSNLDGDCDDGDPTITPDPHTGECSRRRGCGGCASVGIPGALSWPGALALLALLARRRRG